MIYIIEKMIYDAGHEVFNTGMLKVIDKAFQGRKIFYGDKKHIQIIKPHFNNADNIQFKESKVINASKKKAIFSKLLSLIKKAIIDTSLYLDVFRKSKRDKDSRVIITHIHPFSLIFFKLIKSFFPGQMSFLVLHGEVDSVFQLDDFGKPNSFVGKIYKWAFAKKQNLMYYITLSAHGREMLIEDNYLMPDEVISINHPYDYKTDLSKKIVPPSSAKIATVGYVGSLTKKKSGLAFNDLIRILANRKVVRLQLKVIGTVESSILSQLSESIFLSKNDLSSTLMARDIYERKIVEIDYALFLFSPEEYTVRVSGSFYDAVAFLKPIIALRCGFLEKVFDEAGDIGFLCDTVEEVAKKISQVGDEVGNDSYLIQVKNMKNYRDKMSIDSISEELKTALNYINPRQSSNK